jgi:hypothetical protein
MSIIKVKTGGITADAITDALIADDVVGTEHLTANEVDTTALGADAVTGAQLADDAVNSEHYTDGSVDTAHIADAQITTAKLSTAVLTGATDIGANLADADLFLVDDGAGGTLRKSAASRIKTYVGANTPAFHAFLSGNQTVGNNVETTAACNTEGFDTDSAYNTSDYKFTPQVAGKYFIYANIVGQTGDYKLYKVETRLYKNTTKIAESRNVLGNDSTFRTSESIAITVDMNGSSDFLILKGLVDIHVNGTEQFAGDSAVSVTYFGGYKIIE